MSTRHLRRVLEEANPPPEEESDEDYEPLYTQKSVQSKFAQLQLSDSDSEQAQASENSEEDEEEEENACAAPAASSRSKKKNNRKKNKKRIREQQARVKLEEIDRTVEEVNAKLGAPPPAPAPVEVKEGWGTSVFKINAKHLNVGTEIRRLFGPEESEQPRSRQPRVQPNRTLMLKRVFVHPNKDTAVYDFKKSGLSMSKYREENGIMYFVYNHDEHYQKMHRIFLKRYHTSSGSTLLMHLNDARRNMHVEALIEMSDILFRMEEHNTANEIIENVVTFLQYVAHPEFLLTNPNVRLEYKYIENRPFFVAMLKYAYLLSNKACHRTALEIVKMLLVLDPSDPLALLAVIDTLGLRSREHEWMVSATDYFMIERQGDLMYNVKYSLSLANFHVATKTKGELTVANKLLQEAMLQDPVVWLRIMECASISNPKLSTHELFTSHALDTGAPGFDDLFTIYARMTWPRWREPAVLAWALACANDLADRYDSELEVRMAAKRASNRYGSRYAVFQTLPREYQRHLSLLSNMAKLIIETTYDTLHLRPTCSWDPMYEKGINRYKYQYFVVHAHRINGFGETIVRFFESMSPTFDTPPHFDE
ncbi:unnamed protein product [Chrysodeixis includens]|uniref:Transcription factor 25-like n=1 Tax=Chrysodeixis includens TaxID=689277 RepID=A0A9P0BM26_CHRIL|nr:unnamed protein product [Chrysodeixis includens]